MSARKLRLTMAGLFLLHLVVVSLHGFSHHRLGVDLKTWQQGFVGTMILAGPVAALAVFWTLRPRLGTILLAIPMAGSSAFGICYHFLLSSPDDILFLQPSVWGPGSFRPSVRDRELNQDLFGVGPFGGCHQAIDLLKCCRACICSI